MSRIRVKQGAIHVHDHIRNFAEPVSRSQGLALELEDQRIPEKTPEDAGTLGFAQHEFLERHVTTPLSAQSILRHTFLFFVLIVDSRFQAHLFFQIHFGVLIIYALKIGQANTFLRLIRIKNTVKCIISNYMIKKQNNIYPKSLLDKILSYPAIYWLFNSEDYLFKLVYIGRTINLRERLKQHSRNYPFEYFSFEYYPKKKLKETERLLLRDYFHRVGALPKFNSQIG